MTRAVLEVPGYSYLKATAQQLLSTAGALAVDLDEVRTVTSGPVLAFSLPDAAFVNRWEADYNPPPKDPGGGGPPAGPPAGK